MGKKSIDKLFVKKSMKSDYSQAISMGRAIMKQSKDDVHDYHHAHNVEKASEKIMAEFRKKGVDVNFELVKIIALWHDVYKAQEFEWSFHRLVFEGQGSAKIIRKKLEGIITKQDLDIVCRAVINHAGIGLVKYLFFSGGWMYILESYWRPMRLIY